MRGIRARSRPDATLFVVVLIGTILSTPIIQSALAASSSNLSDGSAAWRDRPRWPARVGFEAADATQGIVIELPAGRTTHVWRTISSRAASALGLWDAQRDGESLLKGRIPATAPRFAEIGNGGFGFVRQERDPEDRAEDPACAAAMMFVSARDTGDSCVLQRTWFSLYDPRKGPARGLAVVMPGLFGTPEAVFDQVVRHFQSRNWVVLRMMAQPSGYTEELNVDIADGSAAERDAARLLARTFDDRAAECAYAVEAAIAWAEAKRPEIRQRSRVILGGSGGAMSLPPVAARLHGAFDAAVLIAGGADFATIAATSNYEDWVDSVHIRWSGKVGTPEQIRSLGDAYLHESLLDAYHTAASLEGTKTLVIQATRDKAVPAPQQELLWERLGRPERKSLGMGHETLFVSLPLRMGGIMDWIDAALAPDPAGAPHEEAVESAAPPTKDGSP
mgnify:CR=1 FL=1